MELPTRHALDRGFTLIELMIAVAILAILATVALPSYTDYIRRSQITDATSTLAARRTSMEQFHQDHRNYGTGTTCGNDGTTQKVPAEVATEHFTYGCVMSNANQNYVLTATGNPGNTNGHVYTINDAGTRTTTKFKDVAQSGKNCWLVRGSEC